MVVSSPLGVFIISLFSSRVSVSFSRVGIIPPVAWAVIVPDRILFVSIIILG